MNRRIRFVHQCLLSICVPALVTASVQLSKLDAMDIASQEVTIMRNAGTTNTWGAGAVVADAFPLYLDGISGISYWECKVTNSNGTDAGFVVVSANQSDIIVPESCPTGKTTSEGFQSLLGTNARIFRYGPHLHLAVDVGTGKVIGVNNFNVADQAGKGLFNLNVPHDMSSFPAAVSFRAGVVAKGCYPSFTLAQLQELYANVPLSKQTASTTKSVYLQRSVTYGSTTYYTPKWYQVSTGDGHAIGCANTAWAIVYGYWARFKGKGALFDGLSLTDIIYCDYTGADVTQVTDCMKELYVDQGSFGVIGDATATWPASVPNGIQYSQRRGYVVNSSCTRNENGLVPNFDAIYNEITNDRPVILYISTDPNGSPWGTIGDHYVVVEGARSTTGKTFTYNGSAGSSPQSIAVPDMKYWVNYGWGRASEWLPNVSGTCHDYYAINVGDLAALSFYAKPATGLKPLAVNFTVANNSGQSLSFLWDYGDGTTGFTASHTYTKIGKYTVRLSGRCRSSDRGRGYYECYSYTLPQPIVVRADLTPVLSLLLGD